MMTPPSILHQRIVGNLERLLNDALEVTRPELFAFGNIGIRIPGVADFNPQPDVVVCDADTDYSYYHEQFFLCAEVISPSNTAEMIERKLELYRTHPGNLYVMTIDQDRVRVVLSSRGDGWRERGYESLNNILDLPEFGLSAPLSALYKGTPLAR
jgi:Uma2 family endonuclease